MRPQQWLKNSFVFAGFLYSCSWHDTHLFINVIWITIAFCLVSSAVYIFNDLFDKQADSTHPIKKFRPITCGAITPKNAILFATILAFLSFSISIVISWDATTLLAIYLLLNIAYSAALKHILIIDVLVISIGFMLRTLAGTIGVGISPSNWLLLCGLCLTLFLGFTKRRSEISLLGNEHPSTRKVLQQYNNYLLNCLIAITVICTIASYGLYTMHQYFDNQLNLFYTLPWVIYGMGRYLYLSYSNRYATATLDITRDLFRDKQLLFAVSGWFIITCYLLRLTHVTLS